ncbi:MAG: carbon-nitrogen hydrolase family protein [Rhodothermia bacterium]|nr:carbon-nitrogen hydrolase family protein [Rhodothermia bacterium]
MNPPAHPSRVRVAAAQYYVRPISSFNQFAEQVSAVVELVAGYNCRLLVLPEYFTMQLITLHDIRRPIAEQVRDVATYRERFVEMMSGLARLNGLYIVAGTIPAIDDGDERVFNDSYLFAPSGRYAVQGKLHMTRFEKDDWKVSSRNKLKVFETDFGRLAIAICYDVEFPEIARAAAFEGVHLLAVPSNTDDRKGFLRVRYCAHARTIENQLYVLHSPTVGSIPRVADMMLNYGQASILTPSDYPFSRDGILAEGVMNQEDIIIGELNLETIEESRTFGTVLPLNDSRHTRELIETVEVVSL